MTSVKISENVKLFFLGPKTVQNPGSCFGQKWPKSVHKKKKPDIYIYLYTNSKFSPTFLWVSSWGVGIFSSKLPYVRVFLKNHTKVWISGSNGPWFFFILCGYIDILSNYLYMLQKIFTNILMGFKILCQVEDFEYFFKITLCTCVFEKTC